MLRYSKERLAEERSITDIYFKAQQELDVRKELYEKFRRKLTDEELASLDDEDTSYKNIDFNGYKLYVNGKSVN